MEHIKVHTPQYVCFNQQTGEIFSIGPSIEDGYQFIEVTEEEICLLYTSPSPRDED